LGIGGTGVGGRVNPLFAGLPGWLNAFEPTFYIPGFIYGYPYVGAVEQPLGHRIISTGASGYIYEPVMATELGRDEGQTIEEAINLPADAAVERVHEPAQQAPPERLADAGRQFVADAIEAFQRQKYDRAIKSLEQLQVVAPAHPPAELLRAQALFARGEYEPAADALRGALGGLPEDQWGLIVENYLNYYLLAQPFVRQLRALEKYVAAHPDSAEAQLLLGYEYGYLGYVIEADERLQRARELAPDDRVAERMAARFGALANRQRAARGEQPRLPAKPRPEGVGEGPREF
jgi:tetratricopeptide (TPR) repeat protein